MLVKIIQPSTAADFEKYYSLRWEILRKPWGKPIGSEKDEHESSSFHFMAQLEGEVIGVCRIQYVNDQSAQIRFMAVAQIAQGKGIGKKLIEAVEKYAQEKMKVSAIILQARENAVPFYHSCGYEIKEKTFLLFNEIQHFLMQKTI